MLFSYDYWKFSVKSQIFGTAFFSTFSPLLFLTLINFERQNECTEVTDKRSQPRKWLHKAPGKITARLQIPFICKIVSLEVGALSKNLTAEVISGVFILCNFVCIYLLSKFNKLISIVYIFSCCTISRYTSKLWCTFFHVCYETRKLTWDAKCHSPRIKFYLQHWFPATIYFYWNKHKTPTKSKKYHEYYLEIAVS